MRHKHIAYILTGFLLFLCSSLPAMAEVSLLWKKSFDSRIVKTGHLGDLKPEKGADFPLKTVMTEKSVFLLDARGNTDRRIPLKEYDKAVLSDDGTTLAGMKGKEILISDLDKNQVVGTVKIGDPQPFVLPQHISFEVSDKILVVISRFANTIYFHENNGRRLSEYPFEDLRKAKVRFSRDGRYLAVHVPNWGQGKTSGFLLFFNNKGEKLWRFDHQGCEAAFDISADGQAVVLAAKGRLYGLDGSGKVVYERETDAGNIEIRLSSDGGYAALAQKNKHVIRLLNNQNGDVVWSENVTGYDSANSLITSLDVSENGSKVGVTISKDWTNQNRESFLYLFGKSGNTLWQNCFKKNRVNTYLSLYNKGVLIIGDMQLFLFKMK